MFPDGKRFIVIFPHKKTDQEKRKIGQLFRICRFVHVGGAVLKPKWGRGGMVAVGQIQHLVATVDVGTLYVDYPQKLGISAG